MERVVMKVMRWLGALAICSLIAAGIFWVRTGSTLEKANVQMPVAAEAVPPSQDVLIPLANLSGQPGLPTLHRSSTIPLVVDGEAQARAWEGSDPAATRARLVSINPALLNGLPDVRVGDRLELALFADVHFTALVKAVRATPPHGLAAQAELEGASAGAVDFTFVEDRVVVRTLVSGPAAAEFLVAYSPELASYCALEVDRAVRESDHAFHAHAASPEPGAGSLTQAVEHVAGISNAMAKTIFGGKTFKVEDLPDCRFRRELELLTPEALAKAVETLRNEHFSGADLNSLSADASGGIDYRCDLGMPPPTDVKEIVLKSGGPSVLAAVPIDSPPMRHSKAGSTNVLYLDFNGGWVDTSYWNDNNSPTGPAECVAYSTDADKDNFSDGEQTLILDMWARVAEDYAPFDIDVTTDLPMGTTNYHAWSATTAWAMITPTTDKHGTLLPHHGYGGIANLGGFGSFSYAGSSFSSPAWVTEYSTMYSAEAASHEVGHNMGLNHDGQGVPTTLEYYGGHAVVSGDSHTWNAIMGGGVTPDVGQWTHGAYYNPSNAGEDDLAEIAAKCALKGSGYRPDDHGDSLATASALGILANRISVSQTGLVETTDDPDVFIFACGSGTVTLNASTYKRNSSDWGANLDIVMELRNSGGVLLITNDPATDVSAGITTTVAQGTYYLTIKPTGVSSPTSSPPYGYTSYGSLGNYAITGTVPVATGVVVIAPNGGEVWYRGQTNRIAWSSGTNVTGAVRIDLYRGGLSNQTIVASVTNSGSYTWSLPSGLMPGLDYAVRIASASSTSVADVSDSTFSILAPPVTLLSEGFESSTNVPVGWTQTVVSGSTRWRFQNGGQTGGANPANAHAGTNNACLYDLSASDDINRLITPAMNGTGYTNVMLRFWHHQAIWPSDQDRLNIWYKTNVAASWVWLAGYSNDVSAWTEVELALPGMSTNYSVAFEGNAKYGYGVCLDDIEVSADAPLAAPLAASTSSLNVLEGSSNTFYLALPAVPAGNVTVDVARASGDADLTVATATAMVFTVANGTNYQAVTIRAAQDGDAVQGTADFTCADRAGTYSAVSVTATEIEDEYSALSVLGLGGITIADGDATPSLSDGTDFGSVQTVTGWVSRTFSITNRGTATLVVSGITTSGSAAADFTVTNNVVGTLAPGAKTNFGVVFNPGVGGARSAEILVANDNPTNNPYNFAVGGTALAPGLAYGSTVFTEAAGNSGAVNNDSPLLITLSNDTFTGSNGSDFYAAGKVLVTSLPGGLIPVITKSSDTLLAVTLTGNALEHGTDRDATNVQFSFQNSAFAAGSAAAVSGYSRSDLRVDFFGLIVTNAANSGAGTLRACVANVTSNDVITFASWVTNIVLTTGEVAVIRPMRIEGPGPGSLTISGNSTSRIFFVDGFNTGTVSLSGLRLTAAANAGTGAVNDDGAAVFVDDEALVVSNCVIDGCANYQVSTGEGGAAIYSDGGAVTVVDSVLSNNVAYSRGGAIFVEGALTLRGCTIANNVSSNFGGAIYFSGATNLVVSNCTLVANSNTLAGADGGAIFINSSAAVSELRDSLFERNSTVDNGGAIELDGTSVLYNVAFTNNAASDGAVEYVSTAYVWLTDVAIVDNIATGTVGGLYQSGAGGYLYASNCLIANNRAGTTDGGVLVQGNADLVDCTLAGNVAGTSSGGMRMNINSGKVVRLTGCVISNNVARNGGGGGLYVDRMGCELVNCQIVNNTSTNGDGGGIYLTDYSYSTLMMSNCTVAGNVIQDTAAQYGAGLLLNGSAAIYDTLIADNHNNGVGSDGGGLRLDGDWDKQFVNCTISGNSCEDQGGAVSIAVDSNTVVSAFYNCTVASNVSDTLDGGGVVLGSPSGLVRLYSTLVYGNDRDGALTVDNDLEGAFDVADSSLFDSLTGSITVSNACLKGTNPLLGELVENGGSTKTHALQAGSPAIDAGSNPLALIFDQRGFGYDRVRNGVADIGAYEANSSAFYPLLTYAQGYGVISPLGSNDYAVGSNVVVTAMPSNYYLLSHWAGSSNGSVNPLTITMTGAKTVTAVFAAVLFTNGTPQAWLAENGLVTNDAGAVGDTDGDGMLAWQEYIAGTQPTNGASRLKLADIRGQLVAQSVAWSAVSGRVYTLQWSSNLFSSFVELATNLSVGAYTDAVHGAEGAGFYRMDVQLAP